MENTIEVLSALLMAGITFPLSFFLARLCLRGVVRLVTTQNHRALR